VLALWSDEAEDVAGHQIDISTLKFLRHKIHISYREVGRTICCVNMALIVSTFFLISFWVVPSSCARDNVSSSLKSPMADENTKRKIVDESDNAGTP
jgi:hypothetical protein